MECSFCNFKTVVLYFVFRVDIFVVLNSRLSCYLRLIRDMQQLEI